MRNPRQQRYRDIVSHFTRLVQTNLEKPVPIPDFSRAVGIGPRHLGRAVQEIHGVTPVRYVRTLRLTEVRRTLSTREGAASSVTVVALRFGFHELGRFAAAYYDLFGESPSATRQRTLSES